MIDSTKKYIGWCVAVRGFTSFRIKQASYHRLYRLLFDRDYALKDKNLILKRDDAASHAFMLHNNTIYESHFKTHGVHKQAYEEWFEKESKDSKIYITECDFDLSLAELHVENKTPYSIRDILRARLCINEPLDDGKLICSEYVAKCTKSVNSVDFCKYYKFAECSENCIIPLHIQLWALKEKKEVINLTDAAGSVP